MRIAIAGRVIALAGARLLLDAAGFGLVLLTVPAIHGPEEPTRLAVALLVLAVVVGAARPLMPYLTLPVFLALLPLTLTAVLAGVLSIGAALATLAGVPVRIEGPGAAVLGGVVLAVIFPLQTGLLLALRRWRLPALPGRTRWKLWRIRRLRARLEGRLEAGRPPARPPAAVSTATAGAVPDPTDGSPAGPSG